MNWQTWKAKGEAYLAVDRGDGWHITRQDGENYGAWSKVEAFRKLQRDNDPNGFLGLPETKAKIRVEVFKPDTRMPHAPDKWTHPFVEPRFPPSLLHKITSRLQ